MNGPLESQPEMTLTFTVVTTRGGLHLAQLLARGLVGIYPCSWMGGWLYVRGRNFSTEMKG